MPHDDPLNWRPISEMPLIASMVDRAIDDTRDHIKALTEARARPHVLDDATIDRVEQVHTEQLAFPDIYASRSAAGEPKHHRPRKPANSRPRKPADWTGWRNKFDNYEPSPRTSLPLPSSCSRAPSIVSWQ